MKPALILAAAVVALGLGIAWAKGCTHCILRPETGGAYEYGDPT